MIDKTQRSPQIKICGLKTPGEARAFAAAGADAVGCVFYPPSKRHLTAAQAADIVRALPRGTAAVGVFVNETYSKIMRTVNTCSLTAIQLHGQESPQMVSKLKQENLTVIKALYIHGSPSVAAADQYDASAFLVECSRGELPGGNAMAWNWEDARPLGQRYPLILAGGLTPHNVSRAVEAARPAAVDVSSGVEVVPGVKDAGKVNDFIDAVRLSAGKRSGPDIF